MSGSRILVVGAGATGGYFGARLGLAGRNVTLLVREHRAAALRSEGLILIAPEGQSITHPGVTTADQLDPAAPYDVVLLGVRADALASAIDDMAAGIGRHTVIIPFLNGVAHLNVLSERFGTETVLGGVVKVASFLTDSGVIHQLAPGASLEIGAQSGSRERAEPVAALLSVPGISTTLSTQILTDMWAKWVFIVSITSITTLMNQPVGRVASVPNGADVAARIVREAAAVSAAAGFPMADVAIERLVATATDAGSKLATSVFRSMKAGLHTEVETMLGAFIDSAHSAGVDTPLIDAATVRLRVYERWVVDGAE